MPDQNWFELSALPTILSFEPLPLRHEVLFRNTEVPRVEGEVALGVVDADVVGHRHRAGVAVVGEPVLAVVVGDVAPDDVVDLDVLAAELVAVAVAVAGSGCRR